MNTTFKTLSNKTLKLNEFQIPDRVDRTDHENQPFVNDPKKKNISSIKGNIFCKLEKEPFESRCVS
jgi:hypothetical protein